MKRMAYAWKAVSILSASSIIFGAYAGPPEAWQFHPLATAPYLEKAPAIDGDVGRAEWTSAAELGPLLTLAEGVANDLPHHVYVGYDDKNLYIAFQIDRPANVRQPMTPDRRDHTDIWRAGDSVELLIDVGHTTSRYYGFVLHANGAHGEGIGSPGMNRHWDCAWQQAASITARGWQGEVAIPFTSLELKEPPRPGDVWGFDFVDNQRTPYELVSLWAFRGQSWHKLRNFGHLKFGARDASEPAIRVVHIGEAGDGTAALQLEAVNSSSSAVQLTASVQLFKRKEGSEGGAKSYFDQIESGSDDAYESGQVDFYKGTKLEDLIVEATAQYAPVEGAAKEEQIEVTGGQRRDFGVTTRSGAGEYLAQYSVRAGTGTNVLAGGAHVFRIEPPLALRLDPYWLHTEKIHVTADLKKVTPESAATLSLSLHRAGRGDALAKEDVAVGKGALDASGWLSTKDIEPGFYEVRAVLRGADGKELASSQAAIEKPKPPVWHNNTFGRTLEVPKPWTPLKAGADGRVEMWGRVYKLDRVFPTSIVSQGEELLPEPMSLVVNCEGKPLAWSVKTFKLDSASPGKAVYEVALESEKATLCGAATIEFDGFTWYDLVLKPKAEKLAVDSMAFSMALVPKHSTLLDTHKYLWDKVLSGKPPKPAKMGPPGVLADALLPFTPHVWIGDETGGIAWIGEGPIDWQIEKPNEVIEVQAADKADGTPSRVLVHMIDHPSELTKPMRMQFGIQATPARAMPDPNVINVLQVNGPGIDEAWFRQIAEAGCKSVSFHGGWKGNEAKDWGGWPSRPETSEGQERIRTAMALAHKYGMRATIYTGWGVSTDSDEWKHFGREMIAMPIENSGFGTYRQSAGLMGAYIDYMAWAIADLVKEYDIDGVLWDSTSNLQPDENIGIGNGWIDEQGRVRPTFAVRATRELFKRVYTLTHGELKDGGLVINHAGSIWCINVFSDIHHRGEGKPMHVNSLREAWQPLEDFRGSYDGRKYGIPFLAMNKNFKRLPMRVNNHNAVVLLFGYHCKSSGIFLKYPQRAKDYSYEGEATHHIWLARLWLPWDDSTKTFFCYDKAPEVVQLDPATLLASAFVSGDGKRALLVVSNLDKKEIEAATVTLDRAKLGMRNGTLRAEDAVLHTPVDVNDATVKLDIAPERFRLLKLWAE